MRFSVIIPAYNRAEVIGQAIGSVLKQSFGAYEIIVVDDGSTDETAKVVQKQYGSEVRLIRQDNRGPGAARNTGIQVARGDYAAFLDSDDAWLPWTLSVFDRAIRENDRPAFVAGVRAEGEVGECLRREVSQDEFSYRWWRDYYTAAKDQPLWIGTPAAAIRLDILRSVGCFSVAQKSAEDSDLWMRLGVAPGFVRITHPPVFVYRRANDGLVQDLVKTYRGITRMIIREREGRYPGGMNRESQRRKIVTRHVRAASLRLIRSGYYRRARTLYCQSLRWNWQLRRLRYILGAPAIGLAELIKSLCRASTFTGS